MKKSQLLGALTLVASLCATTAALAQTPLLDWSPWYGCWHAQGAPAGEVLCVVPDGAGVRMVTVSDGVTRAESRVIADGRTRTVAQEDCRGTEQARWSADHERVFLNSELSCGEGVRRSSSGMLVFSDASHWLSVHSVTVDGRTATRSIHYTLDESTRAPADIASLLRADRAVRTFARAGSLSEADISEASEYIDEPAVQEWLRAAGEPYQLGAEDGVVSGSALAQLDRLSGDEDGDHVVIVERPVYVERTYVRPVVRSCWDPFFGGVVVGVSRHVALGVSYGSYCGRHYYTHYSPWGYDPFGWRVFHRPVVVIHRDYDRYRRPPIIRHREPITPRPPFVRHETTRPRDQGRVTRNGYTTRSPQPAQPRTTIRSRDRQASPPRAPTVRASDARTVRAQPPRSGGTESSRSGRTARAR